MEGWLVLLGLCVLAMPVLLVVALVMLASLRRRVAELEERVAWIEDAPAAAPAAPAEARAPAPPPAATAPAASAPTPPIAEPPRPVPPDPVRPAPASARPPPVPPPLPPAGADAWDDERRARAAAAARAARATQPGNDDRGDWLRDVAARVRRWFTEGNVPVKVGMLVLFAGVAALLKYASDQGWLRLPIELRLAGVALVAIAALGFAWRQREARRSFALALQGGAIGVLLLVVFAAFKLYALIPAGAAFALSVVLVAGVAVLAVLQDSRTLAILGVLAGFLAPIWLSTGQGSHVALFGYYAVLNLGIVAIAWHRAWRELHLLGFLFTFGIGATWGALRYRPEFFDTTQPFLLLFFAIYLAIPVLHARRARHPRIDGTLVFGTPLVAFALQAGLLEGARMPLAFCALGLGALYALLGVLLRRRDAFAELVDAFAVLAVGFATLAVPLALSAQATAAVFALEGAGLVWLGLRQGRTLPQLAGALLQIAAAGSLLLGLIDALPPTQPVANAPFVAALLIAVAGFASAWAYWRARGTAVAALYFLWAIAWWLGNGAGEIDRFVVDGAVPDALLAFLVATAALAGLAYARIPATALAWTAALGVAAALPLALWQDAAHRHPFADHGLAAWTAYAALGYATLHALRARDDTARTLAHLGWLGAWTVAAGLALHDLAGGAGDGWRFAAAVAPWLLAAALLQLRPRWVGMPFGDAFDADPPHGWRALARGLAAVGLLAIAVPALLVPGDAAPLAHVPLLNPLELAQLIALGLLAAWIRGGDAPADLRRLYAPLLGVAVLAFATSATLRAAHHWGGVPWSPAMFDTGLVQTSLTVLWSVFGVAGWIVGSRRGQRGLWLAGALLMGVVLAKLVLVDRTHLGNLLGIVSFLAYGLLCTAVGWFAPVPPRARDPEEAPA